MPSTSKANSFIDDNLDNFANSHSENAVLITAPYNKNIDIYDSEGNKIETKDPALSKIKEISFCNNVYRFNSLRQFAEKLRDNNLS